MKELTIEQKAEAYDAALSVALETYQTQPMYRAWLKKMFPELSESEYEEIRKEMIDFTIKVNSGVTSILANNYDFNKWIAWLKKQGEQKPATDIKVIIPKFRVGDIVKSKSQPMLSPRKIISIGKDYYLCEDRGCIGFAWEDDCEIVEQKTAEWSEEDEKRIANILSVLSVQVCWDGATGKKMNPYQKEIDWLKSLRLQNHWKPSQEQIEALYTYIYNPQYFNSPDPRMELVESVYKDLKKLKEE